MAESVYTGFHAIEERLKSAAQRGGAAGLSLYYSKGGPRADKILSLARALGVRCVQTDDGSLSRLVRALPPQARDHRGLVLTAAGGDAPARADFDEWLAACPERATAVMLDGVTDPHNVGAIIRSCDQLGADILIMPKRRSAGASAGETIARASAGAASWVRTARVANLTRAAERLKGAGFWIYCADSSGEPLGSPRAADFAPRTCIVLGSEGSGVSRVLKASCDAIVAIPAVGRIDSLNVSVAAGILLYERLRQIKRSP